MLRVQGLGFGRAHVQVLAAFLQDVRELVGEQLLPFHAAWAELPGGEEDVVLDRHRLRRVAAGDLRRPGSDVHADSGEVAAQELLHPRLGERVEAARLVQGGTEPHLLRSQLPVGAVAVVGRAEEVQQLAEVRLAGLVRDPRRPVAEGLDSLEVLPAFPEHLVGRLQAPVDLLRPLVHRGGLRADIITGGVIRLGDEIEAID